MKKMSIFIALLSVVFLLKAQTSEVRSVSSFKGVRVSEDIDVYLKKGDKESLRVEATGVSPSEVITEVSGTYLKIHMRNGGYEKQKTVKVFVVYQSLDKLSASAAANIFSEGRILSQQMMISVSSAASIEVGIEASDLRVETSSAGEAVLEGKATSTTIEASSAGTVDAYKIASENVVASASSAGHVKVSVSNSLVASAHSAGSIRYRGNPTKTIINADGGGSVKKSN